MRSKALTCGCLPTCAEEPSFFLRSSRITTALDRFVKLLYLETVKILYSDSVQSRKRRHEKFSANTIPRSGVDRSKRPQRFGSVLSITTGTRHCRVCGGWWDRRRSAHDVPVAVGTPRPAIHRREPTRRRLKYRDRSCRECAP